MFKKFSITFLILGIILTFPKVTYAHCPLCTAGAGAGLILSRWLGIDDSITGIWMAGFLGASSLWASNSLKAKGPKSIWPGGDKIPYLEHIIYWLVSGSTIWSFYAFKLVTPHNGMIMGIPKLIFGMMAGAVVFYLIDLFNKLIRKYKGRVLFPYQPIAFSIGSMLVLSIFDFIFINYYI